MTHEKKCRCGKVIGKKSKQCRECFIHRFGATAGERQTHRKLYMTLYGAKRRHKMAENIRKRNYDYWIQNRDKYDIWTAKYRGNLKQKAYAAFGAIACKRCGYNVDVRALTIDHINGDGYKEKLINNGHRLSPQKIYMALRDNPSEALKHFQILCANCQLIKRIENHEERRR